MPDVDLTELSAANGGSSALRAYVARPDGRRRPGPWPGVVVLHEIFGLDEAMRGFADRVAAAGYLTIAPDLFSVGGARRCLVATMRASRSGVGAAFADIQAARSWLASSADCTEKIGLIGFCLGGNFALLSASAGYDVAAANYGRLPKDPELSLIDACPVVASYGARDVSLRGAAGRLETILTRLDIDHDVKEYPGAGHAFMDPVGVGPRVLRPLFRILGIKPDSAASSDAWRRIEAYFDDHLH